MIKKNSKRLKDSENTSKKLSSTPTPATCSAETEIVMFAETEFSQYRFEEHGA